MTDKMSLADKLTKTMNATLIQLQSTEVLCCDEVLPLFTNRSGTPPTFLA
jgi:hypothetical protein